MCKKLLGLIVLLFISVPAFAGTTFYVDQKRRIDVSGEVGRQMIPLASKLDHMSKENSSPIDIVINSPGGSVMSGLVFLSAMKLAKSRGVKIRCVTTLLSASMAFFFLANCDERYALPNSFLLWHPISMGYGDSQRSDTLIHDANWMDNVEEIMIQEILPTLGISLAEYAYHRHHETMWTAGLLSKIAPKFLVIVDDVVGIDRPFLME